MKSTAGVEGAATGGAVRRVCVLAILAALGALGPLSIDAYIPGLPRLADDLHSSAWAVQLTVTACLAGLALGQLLAGPLSDALGRRGPLLAGLALYSTAGLLCAFAPDVRVLVVLRGVQGLGGAFALVIAYAYVRDLHEGKAAARCFSLLMLVSGLAPVLAPLAGAQVLETWGWRAIFVALAALSAVVLCTCAGWLPESHPPHRRTPWGWRGVCAMYGQLLRDRVLVGHVLANGLSFAAMFAYIAGSPFVLQSLYGLSPRQYSLVFAANAFALIAAAAANRSLVGHLGARRLFHSGVAGLAAASLALLTFAVLGMGLGPILAALLAVSACVGLVLPNAPALVLEKHGSHAGTAAALLGCAQFLFGGLAAPLVGLTKTHSAVPMAAVMAALALAALAALRTLAPAPHPGGEDGPSGIEPGRARPPTADFRIRTAATDAQEGVHHDH